MSTEFDALTAVCSVLTFFIFLFMHQISREPQNGFAQYSQGGRVWSLAWTSFKVKVKGQRSRSPGTKTRFSLTSRTPQQRRNGTRWLQIQRHAVAGGTIPSLPGVTSAALVAVYVWSNIFSSSSELYSVRYIVKLLCFCRRKEQGVVDVRGAANIWRLDGEYSRVNGMCV